MLRQLNAIKRKEFPWMTEVSKNAPQQVIKDLGSAFKRFSNWVQVIPSLRKKALEILAEQIMALIRILLMRLKFLASE